MHSMQAGYLEKAQKYTDKALMQLEKLKSKFVGIRSPLISPLHDSDVDSPLIHPVCVQSAGQQSHPVHVPSHPAGAYHHVPAGHWTQGHSFTRGTSDYDYEVYSGGCLSFLIVG